MYGDLIGYVEKLFDKNDEHGGRTKKKIKFDRFQHTLRVARYAERIYEGLAGEEKALADYESLMTAAIFHDTGYTKTDGDGHGIVSAQICGMYLREQGYPVERIGFICSLVSRHSQKDRIHDMEIPLELVILMEADMLDATGAHGIVKDVWVEAKDSGATFKSMLDYIKSSALEDIEQNPMRTAPAKKIWEEKRSLTREFIRQYERDIEEFMH